MTVNKKVAASSLSNNLDDVCDESTDVKPLSDRIKGVNHPVTSTQEGETMMNNNAVVHNNNDNKNNVDVDVDDLKKEKKSDDNESKRRRRRRQIIVVVVRTVLLYLPYFLGITWTCLHPIVSILTGESKCRGLYIDENSIGTYFVESQASSPLGIPQYLLEPLQPSINSVVDGNNNNNDRNLVHQQQQSRTTTTTTTTRRRRKGTLCDHFVTTARTVSSLVPNLQCHSHGDFFDLAIVTPLSNALDASEEALVVVVPYPPLPSSSSLVNDTIKSRGSTTSTWGESSPLHGATLRTLYFLADPVATPWLAKTVLFVTANNPNVPLEDVVTSFLDAYLGHSVPDTATDHHHHRDYRRTTDPKMKTKSVKDLSPPPIPPRLSGAIIRTLIVLDVDDTSSTINTMSGTQHQRQQQLQQSPGKAVVSVLPQGRKGVLPNADLVFLVGKVLERTSFMNQNLYPSSTSKNNDGTETITPSITFLSHPYSHESRMASQWVKLTIQKHIINSNNNTMLLDPKLVPQLVKWVDGMINLVLFARTMAVGPTPPHAVALDRGIDSLTIHVQFTGIFRRDPSVELIQYVGYLLRALSNLHERLHHSVTLYVLPSPRTFVSHLEYFLPNVLILLPLAIRAFGSILPSMIGGGFDLRMVGLSLWLTGAAMATPLIVSIISLLLPWRGRHSDHNKNGWDESSSSSSNNTHDVLSLLVLYVVAVIFWRKKMLQARQEEQVTSNSSNSNDDFNNTNSNNDDDPTLSSSSLSKLPLSQEQRRIRTIQFATCVLAAYILVPIAFANTSLSYLPSLLWTPLLAFFDYASDGGTTTTSSTFYYKRLFFLVGLTIVTVVTAPPILLVPRIFPTYTPFVQFAYVPLHLHFVLLVLMAWGGLNNKGLPRNG